MNIKNLQLAIIATIALSLASCGNNKSEKENSLDEITTEYETPVSEIEDSAEEISKEPENVVSTSKGNNDVDAMLDSYEDYMNEYISYLKKINNNDMGALADLPALMEKGEEWSKKAEKAKSNMTARQMARMTEIINKINIAMSDMQ